MIGVLGLSEVTAVTVRLPGRMKAWAYPLPPPGFEPLDADHESLLRYGFPHRPRDPQLLRVWTKALSRPVEIVTPRYEIAPSSRRHSRNGIANSSNHWSGAELISAPGQIFENVIAIWAVPNTFPDPNVDGWSYCSSWVGIGDATGNHLLQAGVEARAAKAGVGVDHDIYAWCEALPYGEAGINLPVSAGDTVLCAMGAAPSYDQNTPVLTGHIWFANLSKSIGTIIGVEINYFAATNAEWIVERPGDAANAYHPAGPLAYYGQVTFSECSAVVTGAKTPANLSGGIPINMTGANGHVISTGQILNSSTVECSWDGYE
jgi:Peptidase A4 family